MLYSSTHVAPLGVKRVKARSSLAIVTALHNIRLQWQLHFQNLKSKAAVVYQTKQHVLYTKHGNEQNNNKPSAITVSRFNFNKKPTCR